MDNIRIVGGWRRNMDSCHNLVLPGACLCISFQSVGQSIIGLSILCLALRVVGAVGARRLIHTLCGLSSRVQISDVLLLFVDLR